MSENRFTPEKVEAANQKVAKLRRDLDITNADHIVLWIEANTIPDEPMNQCASWLACQIVEAYERAIVTRPAANVEAEPVAWMYEQQDGIARRVQLWRLLPEEGWSETPLYLASALEQVRKEAAEAAINACYALGIGTADAQVIVRRILKDQTNG